MNSRVCRHCKVEVTVENAYISRGKPATVCKPCTSKNRKDYYNLNKKAIIKRVSDYQKSNRFYINESRREGTRIYINNRLKNNPLFKLKTSLKNRTYEILHSKGFKKTQKYHEYLGCTTLELKSYNESLFQPGMTWNSHSVNGWHIDHIVPLASAKTVEELYKLCHYSNLQPLWADKNRKKSDKIEKGIY